MGILVAIIAVAICAKIVLKTVADIKQEVNRYKSHKDD